VVQAADQAADRPELPQVRHQVHLAARLAVPRHRNEQQHGYEHHQRQHLRLDRQSGQLEQL
jgi:hypothetical protein